MEEEEADEGANKSECLEIEPCESDHGTKEREGFEKVCGGARF